MNLRVLYSCYKELIHMKTIKLIIAASIFLNGLVSYAEGASNVNDSIYIYCHYLGETNVEVRKEGALFSDADFIVTKNNLASSERETTYIDDAEVSILKTELFDQKSEEVGDHRGVFSITTKYYSTKLQIKSEKHVLGYTFAGCIPEDLKEVTVHLMCREVETKEL